MRLSRVELIIVICLAFIFGTVVGYSLKQYVPNLQGAFPKSCTYQGKVYKSGESFPSGDGCNSCSCENGQAACTTIACEGKSQNTSAKTCAYQGKIYKSGESFPAGDGCNKCFCNNGEVGCTLIGC